MHLYNKYVRFNTLVHLLRVTNLMRRFETREYTAIKRSITAMHNANIDNFILFK